MGTYSLAKFLIILLGGTAVGFFLEKIVISQVRAYARKRGWDVAESIARSMHNLITEASFFISLHFAHPYLYVLLRYSKLINQLSLAAVILLITIAAARFAGEMINNYTRKQEGLLPSTSIFTNITRVAVYVVGVLVVLQTLGIAITPILTTLGVGGIAVALALKDTLSNLFAGIQVLASRQLKPGDMLELDTGHKGYVVDVTWRNTTVRDFADNLIIIPNSKIANSVVVNYNLPAAALKVRVNVGVAYGSDLEKVEKTAIDVARETVRQVEGEDPQEDPVVRFTGFGESSIDFIIIITVRNASNQFVVRHEFIKNLHRRFEQEGIVIPFPIRTVHLKKEQ